MNRTSGPMLTVMLGAAAVTGQFVSAKATRDALFLSAVDATALPAMLVATSVCSMLLVVAHDRWAGKLAPATLVPAAFVVSGALFLVEWLVRAAVPAATAVVLYLHISGGGPLLASGFWLLATERFDPRTAKARFGQIAGAGTLGGVLGGLLSERVAAVFGAPAMLVVLAALQLVAAWLVTRFAASLAARPVRPASEGDPVGAHQSGWRVVAQAPHLRQLGALVLLGTTGAALLEYLFKLEAVDTLGRGDRLLRFFALYYAGTSLASFLLQALSSRRVLERCGLALTISSPSVALLAGSIGGLVAPGFASLAAGRAGESIFRGSWFRAGYELFYTPIAASERRAAKSIIDVGCDRLGDALGGGLVRLVLLLAPASQSSVVLALALLSAVGAIVAASRLNHWYMRELEDSLVEQAGGSSGSDRTAEDSTRNILLRMADREGGPLSQVSAAHDVSVRFSAGDRELQDILALRSRSRRRIIEVLSRDEGVSAALVPHVLPLLAWNPVADYAFFALRKVAEERVGALIDTLLDPAQDYAVRRRLARVFSVCVSQRAADGLLLALDDARFDVRFQSARSLAAILDKNAGIHIDRKRIYAVVLREVAVGRPVWESGRFLDGFVGDSPLDEFVRDRASQSLAHVFTLLSLVLPREPLQIAFRSLHSEDRHLRGTALEYLEGVLPPAIRPRLWPFLVPADTPPPARHHDDVIADLLRSSDSITLDGLARRSEGPIAGFEPA